MQRIDKQKSIRSASRGGIMKGRAEFLLPGAVNENTGHNSIRKRQ